jgi:hypothetical protein
MNRLLSGQVRYQNRIEMGCVFSCKLVSDLCCDTLSATRRRANAPHKDVSDSCMVEGVYAIDHGAEVYAKLSSNFLIFLHPPIPSYTSSLRKLQRCGRQRVLSISVPHVACDSLASWALLIIINTKPRR